MLEPLEQQRPEYGVLNAVLRQIEHGVHTEAEMHHSWWCDEVEDPVHAIEGRRQVVELDFTLGLADPYPGRFIHRLILRMRSPDTFGAPDSALDSSWTTGQANLCAYVGQCAAIQ